jgi:hypothetical protein
VAKPLWVTVSLRTKATLPLELLGEAPSAEHQHHSIAHGTRRTDICLSSSPPYPQRNAQTTSLTPDMVKPEIITL